MIAKLGQARGAAGFRGRASGGGEAVQDANVAEEEASIRRHIRGFLTPRKDISYDSGSRTYRFAPRLQDQVVRLQYGH